MKVMSGLIKNGHQATLHKFCLSLPTMKVKDVKAADEVLSILSLQNLIQLHSNSINSPVDVLLGVVDVRRESHSVSLLS